MGKEKKNYNNPVQATLTGIFDLFKKRSRVGYLSSSERLDGKKILITGSSSGLGYASAIELARRGGEVIMAVRSGFPEKAEAVKKAAQSNKIFIHQVDLTDLNSIKELVQEIAKQYKTIDVVICNAAMVSRTGKKTKSGLDQMFMVNYLAKFALIDLLLKNNCIQSKASLYPRIIFVTSESHRNAKAFKWDDFGRFVPYGIGKSVEYYGYYKLLLVSYARELSRRLNQNGSFYSISALCPGPVNSNIAREAPWIFKPLLRLVFAIFFRSPKKASEPVVYLAASARQETKMFDYLFLMERKPIDEKANNPENGKKLWELSEALLKTIDHGM